ncbi:MAG: hypothetical protein ACHP7B_05565 [Burkholderiales bacterium]
MGAGRQQGAELLWRIKINARLPREQLWADGSYSSRIYASESDRRQQRNGVTEAEPIYRLRAFERLRTAIAIVRGGSAVMRVVRKKPPSSRSAHARVVLVIVTYSAPTHTPESGSFNVKAPR